MNNSENKIIKYVCGDMSGDEQNHFEEDLKNSPEIKDQIKKYKNLLREIKETSDVPVNPDYFVSVVPSFRKKLEVSFRKNRILKWSFSLSSVAAVIVLILMLLLRENTTDMKDVIAEMDRQEVTELVKDMQIDITPVEAESFDQIEQMYIEAISGKDENIIASDLVSNSDILNSLSEEETQMIYDELINKNILKE